MNTKNHPARPQFLLSLLFCGLLIVGFGPLAQAQQTTASKLDRERGLDMLRVVKDDLKKYYYDPALRGMNLEARFQSAADKIKQAASNSQIMGTIAQVLVELDDSHTFFYPPSRVAATEYGWQMQMIGDKCFVKSIKPKSDAEAKGLQVGDEVWSVDGIGPTRENTWLIKYMYYSLRPRAGMRLIIRKPDGAERQVDVLAKVTTGKQIVDLTNGADIYKLIRENESENHLHRHRYVEMGDDVFIWKMPQFDLPDYKVDDMMSKVRKHKALILDLRGNGGGYITTLQRLVGHFFDKDTKIADRKGREEMKPQIGKTRGKDVFSGPLVVLLDSESGSAAEIFARVIQLEKRGKVIGDRSAGAVMESRYYPHRVGLDVVAFYGLSITDADVIMTDGKSLEKTGVMPDELLRPTAQDLANGRDPVLSHAAALVGVTLAPEKAGTMFPIEWN